MIDNLLREVGRLELPHDQFAVFGSGPLSIRNLREANDIDLIVKKHLWDVLSKEYLVINDKLIRTRKIEIYKDWKPWFDNVDLLINSADIINNYRFVKLDYVLRWKREMNREKDKTDVEIIRSFLSR